MAIVHEWKVLADGALHCCLLKFLLQLLIPNTAIFGRFVAAVSPIVWIVQTPRAVPVSFIFRFSYKKNTGSMGAA